MFVIAKKMHPLTKDILFDATLNLLSQWWEVGYRDLEGVGYKDLVTILFPHHTFGTKHASFIKDACQAWELKYNTEVTNLLPDLPSRASNWVSHLEVV